MNKTEAMQQGKRAIPDWQKSRFVRLKTAGEFHCVEILSQDMLVGIGFGGEESLNLDQLVNSQEESRVVKLMAGDECFKLFFLVTISNTYKIISLDSRYHRFFVKLSAFQTSFGLCGRLPKEAKRHEIGLHLPITMLFCSQSLRCIGAVAAIRRHKGGPKKCCKNWR